MNNMHIETYKNISQKIRIDIPISKIFQNNVIAIFINILILILLIAFIMILIN